MMVLRSALFNLFFFSSSFLLTLPAAALSVVAPGQVTHWAKFWAQLQVHAVRIICGIKFEVSGWENLPAAPVVIASRHESAFDILVWIALLPAACFVVKRELSQIPLFGRCISATGMITIDRGAGSTAMRTLLRGGDRAKAEGRYIIIFPEGTRCDPDEHPMLQPGVAALASRTGLPVVPVMTNSGTFWGRRAFRKRPGTIRIVIQPPLAGKREREVLLTALRGAFDPALAVDNSVSESMAYSGP
jgi:1-acyl-sn-glycerol-3-phosphate acyltransferase